MANDLNNLFTKKINEANIFICSTYNNRNGKIDVNEAKSISNLKENFRRHYAYDINGNPISKIKIYDCGAFAIDDPNKFITDLQFKFLNKEKLKFIYSPSPYISPIISKAFYFKSLKENKEPVIIHLGAIPGFFIENNNEFEFYDLCKNNYSDANITFIGGRSYTDGTINFLKKHPNIDNFKTKELGTLGIKKIIDYIQNKYSSDKYIIYVKYDLNINNSYSAMAVEYPIAFGLGTKFIFDLLNELIKKVNVDILEISNFDASKDINNITANLITETTFNLLYTLSKNKK